MIWKRQYSRKRFSALLLCMVGGACLAAAAPKPNIVHILVDDLGWQDVNCYYEKLHGEASFYETPNIDRVASKGLRFMQAYSPSPT
jgi:hypothetical protein